MCKVGEGQPEIEGGQQQRNRRSILQKGGRYGFVCDERGAAGDGGRQRAEDVCAHLAKELIRDGGCKYVKREAAGDGGWPTAEDACGEGKMACDRGRLWPQRER